MNPFAQDVQHQHHPGAMMPLAMAMGLGGTTTMMGAGQDIYPKPPPPAPAAAAVVGQNPHVAHQQQQALAVAAAAAAAAAIPAPNATTNIENSPVIAPAIPAQNENVNGEEEAEDAEERLARSRERNREHARRTRLRKKAQLRALQDRVKELQEEGRVLRQTVEECSIASILLGLSGGASDAGAETAAGEAADATGDDSTSRAMNFDATAGAGPTSATPGQPCGGGKRKRFLLDSSDQAPRPMKLRIRGRVTTIGGDEGRAHINWKTGVYCDEEGVHRQLSSEELESLRRERNRMHAKMTRDRKKSFISAVERTIHELERENARMREVLARQAKRHFPSSTPASSAPSTAAGVVTTGGSIEQQGPPKPKADNTVDSASATAGAVPAVPVPIVAPVVPVVTPGSTPVLTPAPAAGTSSPGRVSPAHKQMTLQPAMMLQPAPAVPVGVPLGHGVEAPRHHRPLTVAPVMPLASVPAPAQSQSAATSLQVEVQVPLTTGGGAQDAAAPPKMPPPAIHGFSIVG